MPAASGSVVNVNSSSRRFDGGDPPQSSFKSVADPLDQMGMTSIKRKTGGEGGAGQVQSLVRGLGILQCLAGVDGGATLTRSEERRVGKSVSVRVDLGGVRILKKKKKYTT